MDGSKIMPPPKSSAGIIGDFLHPVNKANSMKAIIIFFMIRCCAG